MKDTDHYTSEYEAGHVDGYEAGRVDGYDEGYQAGHYDGFNEAMAEVEMNFDEYLEANEEEYDAYWDEGLTPLNEDDPEYIYDDIDGLGEPAYVEDADEEDEIE